MNLGQVTGASGCVLSSCQRWWARTGSSTAIHFGLENWVCCKLFKDNQCAALLSRSQTQGLPLLTRVAGVSGGQRCPRLRRAEVATALCRSLLIKQRTSSIEVGCALRFCTCKLAGRHTCAQRCYRLPALAHSSPPQTLSCPAALLNAAAVVQDAAA